ncbi:MAG: hypothetical protein NTV94_05960 [Planctomycetota bacterium]|nr:hypothetical protein [Planctomycetota bacterium]
MFERISLTIVAILLGYSIWQLASCEQRRSQMGETLAAMNSDVLAFQVICRMVDERVEYFSGTSGQPAYVATGTMHDRYILSLRVPLDRGIFGAAIPDPIAPRISVFRFKRSISPNGVESFSMNPLTIRVSTNGCRDFLETGDMTKLPDGQKFADTTPVEGFEEFLKREWPHSSGVQFDAPR